MVSPDSVLTTVPWGALPQNGRDGPLLEKYAFAVVPSSSYLLQQLADEPPRRTTQGTLLVVADVAFGKQPAPAPQPDRFLPRTLVRGNEKQFWPALPATKRELVDVPELEPGDSTIAIWKR